MTVRNSANLYAFANPIPPQVSRAGTHYLVARGYGEDGSDDSFHAGLNGVEITTSDRITGFSGSLRWSGTTMDGNTMAEFEVPSAGEHTLNVWMREDGFIVDKFILTTNPDFEPPNDDKGPPESPQGGGASGGGASGPSGV